MLEIHLFNHKLDLQLECKTEEYMWQGQLIAYPTSILPHFHTNKPNFIMD